MLIEVGANTMQKTANILWEIRYGGLYLALGEQEGELIALCENKGG